jgi:hypothetical protein
MKSVGRFTHAKQFIIIHNTLRLPKETEFSSVLVMAGDSLERPTESITHFTEECGGNWKILSIATTFRKGKVIKTSREEFIRRFSLVAICSYCFID